MIEFSSKFKVEPITIDGESFEIRELDGEGRDRYMKAVGSSMEVRMNSTGKKDVRGKDILAQSILVKDLNGQQQTLLMHTLFKGEGEEATPVTITTIRKWPVTLQDGLAKVANKLNGLVDGKTEEDEMDEAEKN